MDEILAQPAARVFAVCAAVLVLKMLLTGTGTGLLRVIRGAFITAEDYAFIGKAISASNGSGGRTRTTSRIFCPF